jgi:transcriptional regulator with XRE-family HTH domain
MASGLSTRTIEKVESGRHRPDEQTLRSLARAVDMDVKIFEKSTTQLTRADMERAVRKTVLVPTHPVRTAADFLRFYGEGHAYRIDTSAVENDDALEIAASMADWIRDLDGIWGDCPMTQQLEYARSFASLCKDLETHGSRHLSPISGSRSRT